MHSYQHFNCEKNIPNDRTILTNQNRDPFQKERKIIVPGFMLLWTFWKKKQQCSFRGLHFQKHKEFHNKKGFCSHLKSILKLSKTDSFKCATDSNELYCCAGVSLWVPEDYSHLIRFSSIETFILYFTTKTLHLAPFWDDVRFHIECDEDNNSSRSFEIL